MEHHSALLYLGRHVPRSGGLPTVKVASTINDPVVLDEYHSILIPKAIEYSAGITELTQLIVVYKGTIGLDSGQPADPVDSNIAIAAKRFTMTGLDWSQLQWVDLYSPSQGTFAFNADAFYVTASGSTFGMQDSGRYKGAMAYRGPEVGAHLILDGILSATGTAGTSFGVDVRYEGEAAFSSVHFGIQADSLELSGNSTAIVVPNTGNATKTLEVIVTWGAGTGEGYAGDSGYIDIAGALTNP